MRPILEPTDGRIRAACHHARVNLATLLDDHPGDRTALVAGGDRISYGRLRDEIDATRGVLSRLGLEEGARIAILCGTNPRFVRAWFAVIGAGFVAVPLNPQAPAPEIERELVAAGVQAVIAQGREGGGHTGEVPTSLLVPGCVDVVDVPVIAAGGLRDGRGLVAALALGAAGIAMGTRFLLTQESHVPDAVKRRYLAATLTDTVRTSAVDGHPQRVLRTELVDELERSSLLTRFPRAARNALRFRKLSGTSVPDLAREGLAMRRSQELAWSQLAMAANAPMMTKAALVDGDLGAGVLPTGQVVGAIDELPTVAELVDRVMAEADEVLGRLTAG